MILIVDAGNRAAFSADLSTMFTHRKRVFVDRLAWNVPVHDTHERDSYDDANTTYLLAKHTLDGPLLASARLLSTERPHLMSDVFQPICAQPSPRGASVWEASRFCTSPEVTSRRARVQLLLEIITAIMETSLLLGKDRVVFTANRALLPVALRCCWQTHLLSPTVADGNDEVTAVIARVTPTLLREQRERFGLHAPIARYVSSIERAA